MHLFAIECWAENLYSCEDRTKNLRCICCICCICVRFVICLFYLFNGLWRARIWEDHLFCHSIHGSVTHLRYCLVDNKQWKHTNTCWIAPLWKKNPSSFSLSTQPTIEYRISLLSKYRRQTTTKLNNEIVNRMHNKRAQRFFWNINLYVNDRAVKMVQRASPWQIKYPFSSDLMVYWWVIEWWILHMFIQFSFNS